MVPSLFQNEGRWWFEDCSFGNNWPIDDHHRSEITGVDRRRPADQAVPSASVSPFRSTNTLSRFRNEFLRWAPKKFETTIIPDTPIEIHKWHNSGEFGVPVCTLRLALLYCWEVKRYSIPAIAASVYATYCVLVAFKNFCCVPSSQVIKFVSPFPPKRHPLSGFPPDRSSQYHL